MVEKECKLINERILFDEESHTYKSLDNQPFLSVSSLITLFKPPFDPNGSIITKCAEKKGITVEELRKEWDQIRDDANYKGHKFHSDMENYINTGVVADGVNKVFIKQFQDLHLKGKLYSECVLINKTHKIAGTTDLIELFPNKKINIYDFKTNKKLEKKSNWRQYMKAPLHALEHCNFNHYSIQLSLYAYMLEQYGFWINKLAIFYINPRSNILEVHNVNYLIKDVKKMLDKYRINNAFDF